MATLSANTPRVFIDGGETVFKRRPVSANVRIYQGAILGIDDTTGLCRPFTDGDKFAGFAEGEVNNLTGTPLGGGASAMSVLVREKGKVVLTGLGGSPAATTVGDAVYATTDSDTSLTDSGSDTRIGTMDQYVSSSYVVVSFQASTTY